MARTSLNGRGRVRSNVLQPLANRLGPLASEASGAASAAPSPDLRKMLGTAPPPRKQSLESRLGRPNDQNQTSSQAYNSASNLPATSSAPVGSSSATTAPAEGIKSTSVPL